MRLVLRLCLYLAGALLAFLVGGRVEPVAAAALPAPVGGITTTLTLNAIGSGTVTADPAQPVYTYGQTVTINAAPATGWVFDGWSGDLTPPSDWWDANWDYRAAVNVAAGSVARVDKPVEVEINFTQLLATAGGSGAWDENSLRVVEVNAQAQIINTNLPFQFDRAAGFNATTNATGTLTFIMPGTTAASAGRTFHLYFDVATKGIAPLNVTPQVSVTPGIDAAGQTGHRIVTALATYDYQDEAGAFSSIRDIGGNDWIAYNTAPGHDGLFRGLPNMNTGVEVFRPGVNNATTTLFRAGPLKVTLRTVTNDNGWEALWEFFPNYARMTLLKAGGSYWFTYAGPPGGSLDANDRVGFPPSGSLAQFGNSWVGADLVGEEWAYVANRGTGGFFRSIFLAHHNDDNVADQYTRVATNSATAYFRFGRNGNLPGMSAVPARFTIGMVETDVFATVAQQTRSAYRDLAVQMLTAQSRTAPPPSPPGNATSFQTTMISNRTVNATFTAIPYTLNTQVTAGNGSIARSPDLATYVHGDVVTLTAQPAPGYKFDGWVGGATGTANPINVTMTGNTTVSAAFSVEPYTIDARTVGTGTVTLNPLKPLYQYGDLVTLTAITQTEGIVFSGWSGAVVTTTNPVQLFMDSSKVITATFGVAQYALAITTVGGGTVSKQPNQSLYAYGEIQLTAVPAFGWRFESWSGAVTGTANPAKLLMNENKAVTATFVQQPASTVASDDFNSCALDSNRWNFINPLGDATLALNGVQAVVDVPEGATHDIWSSLDAPRLMQAANNVDFEVEAKFDSALAATYQMQGFLVQQDDKNFLRFNIQREGNDNVIKIVRAVEGQTPRVTNSYVITDVVKPDYMRLFRRGDDWTVAYSGNGVDWVTNSRIRLRHVLNVTSAGVFFGNAAPAGGQAPPFIGVLDYFFNTASPIVPEDPLALGVQARVVGSGQVLRNPPCGSSTVQITAQPSPGWSFVGWSGAALGNTNPQTITVTSSDVVTATFAQEQYRVTADKTGNGAVTVDPFKSNYLYGEVITVTAQPALGWAFKGWSGTVNSFQNPLVLPLTGDTDLLAVFQINQPTSLISDDFNSCELSSHWQFINPNNVGTYSFNGAQILLSVPAGIDHDVWVGGNQAPRLMQAVNDVDFQLEIKFDAPVTRRFQLQGVLAEQDAQNFVRANFQNNGSGIQITLVTFAAGEQPQVRANQAISDTDAVYLQLVRVGHDWQALYSGDGITWKSNEELRFNHALTVQSVGFFVGNVRSSSQGSAPAHTAVVDYFFNRAAPITPEDAIPLHLPVFIVGSGLVARTPECGNPVQLTAVAGAGHIFAGWGGRLTGNQNPVTVGFQTGDQVTALFTPVQFNITTSAQGQGAVTLTPDKPTYGYGEVITVTATAEPGWIFSRWSSGMAGTENPRQLTVRTNRNIRATFEPSSYTLSLETVGEGAIQHTPVRESYDQGEEVVLTAHAAEGWFFTGWSGDLTGNANPATVTINTAKTIRATFTQSPFTLAVSVMGQGQVHANPAQTLYAPGDVVELLATPASGWLFVRWEGALSGTDNPANLVMDQNRTVVAVFAQDPGQYSISLSAQGGGIVAIEPEQALYASGTRATFTAIANDGWVFTHWGGDLEGSVNPTTLTLDKDKNITANFAPIAAEQYSVAVQKIGEGTVTLDPLGPYNSEAIVLMTARPAIGWGFTGWSGDYNGVTNPVELFIDDSKVITATFGQAAFSLNTGTAGRGSVLLSRPGPYVPGEVVTLTAVPAIGAEFLGWSGDINSDENPVNIVMDEDKTVTAAFTMDGSSGGLQVFLPLINRE
jgi:uncharacterized repeat protein (TIGR02543 family)